MTFSFFLNGILLGLGLSMDAFSVSVANALNESSIRRKKMLAVAGTYAFFQAFMPLLGWFCVHTFLECFTASQKFIPWIAFALLVYIGGSMIFKSLSKIFERRRARRSVLNTRSAAAGDTEGGVYDESAKAYDKSADSCDTAADAYNKSTQACGESADTARNKSADASSPLCTPLTFRVLVIQGVATSIDALSVGFAISGYKLPAAISTSFLIAAVTFAVSLFGLSLGKRFGSRLSSRAEIAGGVILVAVGTEILLKGLFF